MPTALKCHTGLFFLLYYYTFLESIHLEIGVTDVDCTTWLTWKILLRTSKVEHSNILLPMLPHHRAQRPQLKVSMQPGFHKLSRRTCVVLSRFYANQLLQQSSRPHIVTLWNYARGKLVKSTGPTSSTVSRYAFDQFSTVSRYLSRTIEWLKAANDLNSKHATSSKSGIRIVWYIGFAEDTNSYSPPIADTINDRRRLWAHFSSVSGLNLSGCERHVDLLRSHIQRNILGRFQEKNDLLNLN